MRPKQTKTFVCGQRQAVSKRDRKWLASLVMQDPEPQRMYSALAEVNGRAAKRNTLISPACFTTHVGLIGEGGGVLHHVGDRPSIPAFDVPLDIPEELIKPILDNYAGPGGARLVGYSTARMDASDEYHETQLREKPDDPSTHSNYGAYLQNEKGDLEGAERAYRRAVELDGGHVNALGNLANLLWEKGDRDEAGSLYRKALEVDPGNEDVTWKYARQLLRESDGRQAARELLDRGITIHPESGRLLLLRAELSLRNGNALEALKDFRQAREKGAGQAEVEAGYAVALHSSSAPAGECIQAYYVAISLNPGNGALRLNLAQLLFVEGDDTEANRQLQEAMGLQLDESAQLEAQFYLLAHTASDPAAIFRTTKSLLSRGACLGWDVRPNIERVRRRDPQKADLLVLIAEIMAGERDQIFLDQALARWPQTSAR